MVNKSEIDVLLELSCFFDDPADVGNLISGSSAFSKTSLVYSKFLFGDFIFFSHINKVFIYSFIYLFKF